jgi:hypothetical protein
MAAHYIGGHGSAAGLRRTVRLAVPRDPPGRLASSGVSDQHPELRVSDADREATVVRLREAGGEGRLTLEELAERVERADAARTRRELDALTADLPASTGARVPLPDAPRKERRWLVAIMGGEQRKGRWRPARRTNAIAVMGGIDIDLREAELADGAEILAVPVMGAVTVIVPEGVSVELSGFALMGGNSGPDDANLPLPNAPVVRVRAFSLMGGVEVKRKPARQGRRHWHGH